MTLSRKGPAVVLAVAMSSLLVPTLAVGQLSGRVNDAAGQPVVGVLVEIWGPTQRLASRMTDEDGEFEFAAGETEGATTLFARRIGFLPHRLNLRNRGRSIQLELVPLPIRLDPVRVVGGALCPNTDDSEARARWEAIRDSYTPPSDHAIWAEALHVGERVPEYRLGYLDTTRLEDFFIMGDLYGSQTHRIVDSGYAVPFSGLMDPRYDLLEYPRLESLMAGHFIDTVFGQLHSLSFVPGSRSTEIVFCPRDSTRPHIEGLLELDASGNLATARWEFVAPGLSETAGGQVWYVVSDDSGETRPLLPMSGLYWRKLLSGFYQEWTEFREWNDCETEPQSLLCHPGRR
jgi:hypothetical protein